MNIAIFAVWVKIVNIGNFICLQAQVAGLEGLNEADLVLFCGGRPLENDNVLSACAADQQTLDVDIRMLGGKVHGSLARAGKVKGQTPKVCLFV